MVIHHNLNDFSQLQEFLNNLKSGEKLVLLFTGGATATTSSWCPDCVAADPIIEAVVEENKEKDFHFAKVTVGSRDEWKDPQCPFRTNSAVKLTSVPTLLLWGSVLRLNDSECQDKENVRLLFEEL